jgi:nicotinamide-nucleotide amidase
MDSTLQSLAVAACERRNGRSIATAESFTGGLVAQALAAVPASAGFFRGGLVAFQPEVKQRLLGVHPGPVVTEQTAIEMARGAAELLRADVAVATTGVAGPDPMEGLPPGTGVIGWCIDGTSGAETFRFPGQPGEVVAAGARAALSRLAAVLAHEASLS